MVAVRRVGDGVLVLGLVCWYGRGRISTLAVRGGAGRGRVVERGRGGGIWATIHGIGGVHGGGVVGGRGGGSGGTRVGLEVSGEASRGLLQRLIAYV